jgi:hypothetical protein
MTYSTGVNTLHVLRNGRPFPGLNERKRDVTPTILLGHANSIGFSDWVRGHEGMLLDLGYVRAESQNLDGIHILQVTGGGGVQ